MDDDAQVARTPQVWQVREEWKLFVKMIKLSGLSTSWKSVLAQKWFSLASNGTYSGLFSDKISVYFGLLSQQRNPGLSQIRFRINFVPIWSQSAISFLVYYLDKLSYKLCFLIFSMKKN